MWRCQHQPENKEQFLVASSQAGLKTENSGVRHKKKSQAKSKRTNRKTILFKGSHLQSDGTRKAIKYIEMNVQGRLTQIRYFSTSALHSSLFFVGRSTLVSIRSSFLISSGLSSSGWRKIASLKFCYSPPCYVRFIPLNDKNMVKKNGICCFSDEYDLYSEIFL